MFVGRTLFLVHFLLMRRKASSRLSLSRQRARKAKPRVTRFLQEDLWQAVKTSIDAMSRDTARAQEHYTRVRCLISLL
ncbi:Phage integrase [Caballeronia udeis]|uniref:Phage integrase n=1 Tax=Caballeronia udeis TaxID=1232866 RepID=A0A158I802_9BURK|nr:Phage integrase [Caballeronia udeis]